MLNTIYSNILIPWILLAFFTFIILFKISAPYGKFSNNSWGPNVSFKWGWIIQEITSPICFSFFFILGLSNNGGIIWLFFIIWNLHYFNRSIIFPLRQKQTANCPLIIVISAVLFNMVNGFINGYFLSSIATYEPSYYFNNNFIIGAIILIIGVIINIKSDNILIQIKKQYQTYKIPKGFMYRYISCPNYFGEIIEWLGFAIMTLSLPAFIFVFWTMANLIPRSISNHNWYIKNFSDYPKNRKAIFPFLL